jgi:acyl-CoA thioester hydrolase
MIDPATRALYADWACVTVRYGDTDRQGHVNNAVFASFLEAGRVNMLFTPNGPLHESGAAFVIARLVLDFKAELNWPGEVWIGTRVARIGRSSMTLEQAIYQNGVCAATAENVIVQMDEATRKSLPLSPQTLAALEALRRG